MQLPNFYFFNIKMHKWVRKVSCMSRQGWYRKVTYMEQPSRKPFKTHYGSSVLANLQLSRLPEQTVGPKHFPIRKRLGISFVITSYKITLFSIICFLCNEVAYRHRRGWILEVWVNTYIEYPLRQCFYCIMRASCG
jgi:hypothetical protein